MATKLRRFLVLSALFFSVALGPRVALAQAISLDIFHPTRTGVAPGSLLTFAGTVTNNTGAALNASDLFFNFSGYDPTVVSLSQLLGSPDFTLNNGATSPQVDLFSFDFGANALPNQTYAATAFLQDANGNNSNVETVRVASVPEAGTLWLPGFGLACLVIFRRKYRSRTRR